MTKHNLYIFDLDGTLVDSFRNIQKSLNNALSACEFQTHDLESTKRMVGNGMQKLVERALPPGTNSELAEEVLRRVKAGYAANPADETKAYPGIGAILEGIKTRTHHLAVLTNKPQDLAHVVVEATGLKVYFPIIIGQRDGKPIKPDPSILPDANPGELPLHRIWMIGDGVPDGEFSRNSGIGFIGVAWGNYPAEKLKPFGPVANTMAELEELIDQTME